MTYIKRHLILFGAFLGTSLMGLAYFISNEMPKYFAGDDFLLLSASRTQNGYASSLFSCVSDVGMDKWRPMFVCTVTPMLKIFQDSYWYYFLVNLVLIFFICLVAGNLLKKLTKISTWSVAFIAFVMPFSRFAWYGRISPYGVMEFGALLFALLFVRQFMLALKSDNRNSWYLTSALAVLSSLFHERYLVLLAAGFLVAILNLRNKQMRIPVTPWLLFVGSYAATKVLLLRIDPVAGGGETPIRSSADTWILEHFLVGVKAVVGIGNGTNIGFDISGYVRQPALGVWGKFWLVAVTLVLVSVCTYKASIQRRVSIAQSLAEKQSIAQQTVMRQVLLISGLLLIVPASTVISRIEGRWLLGPEIVLLIFVISIMKTEIWRIVLLSCYLAFSLSCLQFLPKYEEPIRTTNEILEYVHDQLDGKSQMFYTIIDPRGRSNLLDWQLGRFMKFNQLGVKRAMYVEPSKCSGGCIRIEFQDTERFNLITEPTR